MMRQETNMQHAEDLARTLLATALYPDFGRVLQARLDRDQHDLFHDFLKADCEYCAKERVRENS